MIKGDKASLEKLRAADAKAQGFPLPSSRYVDGILRNVCGDCGAPVDGPETRYRCSKCGKTADEYQCHTLYSADVTDDGYPETVTAVALVTTAKGKANKDRKEDEKSFATLTVEEKLKEDPKISEEGGRHA